MATCNFWTMEDFPLIAFETEDDRTDEQIMADYMECYGEHATLDEMKAWAADCIEIQNDDMYLELIRAAREFSYDLNFYRVEVKAGYYSGVQFYVRELREWNRQDLYGAALNSCMNKERRKICAWLREQAEEHGGMELAIAYRFSNGETGYRRVS